MRFAELLSREAVQEIHDASLEILEGAGILVHNEKARDIYASHDCRVDHSTGLVKFPPQVVEEYRSAFTPTFTFKGRAPEYDRTIPTDRPVVVTASSAPNIVDPSTGKERRATSRDMANIAFLVNELPGYDVFSISTLADDAPDGQFSISRFYPALKNCAKPIRGNTPNMKELLDVLELGAIVAGGKEAYLERPVITHHCCPVISPLTMDVDSTENLIYLVENGLPAYGTIVPNAGLTAPMSLIGSLALGNAEFLAMSTLMQMIRPGTPLIYATLSTVADMRTGNYTPGAIETGLMHMAHNQMARFYHVPAGGYVGLTNAHANDAQAGYETGMSTTGAVLAGSDMLNMGGLLDSLMTFDFGKAMIDNEIALMLKRLVRFPGVSENNLCLDLISTVGPGGSYIKTNHTLKQMRKTSLLTHLAERGMRSKWEEAGRPDVNQRALKRVNSILNTENPAKLSEAVEAQIRNRFKGLVAGDARWETRDIEFQVPKEKGGMA